MSLKRLLFSYSPLFVALIGLAVLVTVAPSVAPVTISGGAEDLLDQALREPGAANAPPSSFVGEDAGQPANSQPSSGVADPDALQSGGAEQPSSPASSDPGSTPSPTPGRQAPDCSRNEVINNPTTCRPPAFAGDNGGSTYAGVTADVVNLVVYQNFINQQVGTLLAQAGYPSKQEIEDAALSMSAWFNENFETWGRVVNPIPQRGTGNDASSLQADAITTAVEHEAFSVVTPYVPPTYFQELHRKGITSVASTLPGFDEDFEAIAPHGFSMKPTMDTILDNLADYMCKKLVGRPAAHAGDPAYQVQERKIGIFWQAEAEDVGPRFEQALARRCGGVVAKSLSYPAEIENAIAIATNAVAQMKAEGVTTVTCVCDGVAPIYFTQQATNQQWFPEWIHNGWLSTDDLVSARAYDQVQWSNSFGPSIFGYPELAAESAATRTCLLGGLADRQTCVRAARILYLPLLTTFEAIEAAGPALTDRAFAQQLFGLAPKSGRACELRGCSFGRQGPGDYTFVDDYMEIWYSAQRTAPDGKPGAFWYVGGKDARFRPGNWPAGDPMVFVDDGSEQPPRDPDT